MCIYMAGVDVHSADVSERERFAFSEEQVRHILQELVQKDGISGAVLLATCNRTELYLSVQSDRERTENNAAERQPAEQISPAQLLQYYAGSSAEPPHILVRTELDAAQHLMEVACGLHSQILHEEQIVTQVGRAVELARECHTTDSVLDTLFRTAVSAGKDAQNQVSVSQVPLLWGSAAAGTVHRKTGWKKLPCDRKRQHGTTGGITIGTAWLPGVYDTAFLSSRGNGDPLWGETDSL